MTFCLSSYEAKSQVFNRLRSLPSPCNISSLWDPYSHEGLESKSAYVDVRWEEAMRVGIELVGAVQGNLIEMLMGWGGAS